MEKTKNIEHWTQLSRMHGSGLLATTKCETIKMLELSAISSEIKRIGVNEGDTIVEVGCGNGINIQSLQENFSENVFFGFDYIGEMINSATAAVRDEEAAPWKRDKVALGVLDVREFAWPPAGDTIKYIGKDAAEVLGRPPSIVFSDRCLINLSSLDEQATVIERIMRVVAPGGAFLMLENSKQTHATLNELRSALGLPARPAAEYNVFIDEDALLRRLPPDIWLEAVRDISTLHDIVLYAAQSYSLDGDVHYDTDLMKAITVLSMKLDDLGLRMPPAGQNRLWVFRQANGRETA